MRTVSGHIERLLKWLGSIHLYPDNEMLWPEIKGRLRAYAIGEALTIEIGGDSTPYQICWHVVMNVQDAVRGLKAHATTK